MISIKQSVYQINDLITKMTVTERAKEFIVLQHGKEIKVITKNNSAQFIMESYNHQATKSTI